jgi:hypothetical protein
LALGNKSSQITCCYLPILNSIIIYMHTSNILLLQLPVLDGLVDTFMSRDADSVILPRERDAVVQWLASNQSFHMMRDHPAHCIFMLGGLYFGNVSQRA